MILRVPSNPSHSLMTRPFCPPWGFSHSYKQKHGKVIQVSINFLVIMVLLLFTPNNTHELVPKQKPSEQLQSWAPTASPLLPWHGAEDGPWSPRPLVRNKPPSRVEANDGSTVASWTMVDMVTLFLFVLQVCSKFSFKTSLQCVTQCHAVSSYYHGRKECAIDRLRCPFKGEQLWHQSSQHSSAIVIHCVFVVRN